VLEVASGVFKSRKKTDKVAAAAIAILGASVFFSPGCVFKAAASGKTHVEQTAKDWPVYGGQPAQDHYSSLTQINRKSVKNLKVAWTFDLEEKGNHTGSLQSNPLIIGRMLYTLTPSLKVIALDAATGKLIWKFDSGVAAGQPSRGLTYWTEGKESRLFVGIMNYLYALDPATGKPIESFGEGGRIDLRKNLRGDYRLQSVALTSPGVIYKDLIIVGAGTLKPSRRLRATSVPLTFILGSCAGHSTQFLIRANRVTKLGPRMRGKRRERPITGPGWRSMSSEASFTYLPVLRFPIFMVPIA
jgi:glucose dehydrogenase